MNKRMMTIDKNIINSNERLAIAILLFVISVLVIIDIYNDYFEGVALWHNLVEFIIASIALVGVFYMVKDLFRLKRTLQNEQQFSKELQEEAEKWRRLSRTYLEGLSLEIDEQLNRWNLTEAEKEVTFLILKGFSDKKIAEIRTTSVKTIRTQANAIYSKSGLSGRSELSAFFLEDLLLPKQ